MLGRVLQHTEKGAQCVPGPGAGPRSVAPGQEADGQPDCSHIRREVVSFDERNRSRTFCGEREKNAVLSTHLYCGPKKPGFKVGPQSDVHVISWSKRG